MPADPSAAGRESLTSFRSWRARRRFERKLRRLTYAHKRCDCGALYAYDPSEKPHPTAWDCSDILLDLAVPSGQPGAVMHGDLMPFVFWKVKAAPKDWALDNRVKKEPV